MSLLDDLKKEAGEVRSREERERQDSHEREMEVKRAMVPTMRALYGYFKELKSNLDVVQPDLEASYEVEGVGSIGRLRQCDYRLLTDDPPDRVTKFTFQYAFARGGTRDVRSENRSTTRQIRDRLWQHGLKFTSREAGDGSASLSVENRVPVSFEFEADYSDAMVVLRVRNRDRLGLTVHRFALEQLNRGFMEEVTRCVLGKPNRFDELTGRRLTDANREKLRERLAAERESREQELGRGAAPDRPGTKNKPGTKKKIVRKKVMRKKPSLTQRLGRTLFGRG